MLYDPTEKALDGRTGKQEADALANRRGIPLRNVHELPNAAANQLAAAGNVGEIIVIAHGVSSTQYKSIRLRKRQFATASLFVQLLEGAGLDLSRVDRYELIVCKAASGNDTFAAQLYNHLWDHCERVVIKAAVGFASVNVVGDTSVSFYHPSDPDDDHWYMGYGLVSIARAFGRWSMSRTVGRLAYDESLGDFWVYPSGATY